MNSRPIQFLNNYDFDDYSEIIDVRSPAEFAEDHVPGAINCYVLDNEQRAEVGTLYKQVSPFEAKKLGAALISKNIGHWLETHFRDKPKDYRPLVYCWRGGQRSGALATILTRIGWETTLIDGGYKQYRQWVREKIEEIAPQLQLIVLAGLTGTGKTALLHRLDEQGEQVLDLEGLANHRGSLLGADPDTSQPAQKYFESLLCKKLDRFDTQRTVWIESESIKIGNIHCPAPLWKRMKTAVAIEITAPIRVRAEYLLRQYDHFTRSPDNLMRKLAYLKDRLGSDTLARWQTLIDEGNWTTFVEQLLDTHYDPTYRRSMQMNERKVFSSIAMESIDEACINGVTDELTEYLSRHTPDTNI